jgi:hypothetical protein
MAMRRLPLALALAALAATPAHAATVSSDGTTLSITAGPAEQNTVEVTLAPTLLPPALITVRDATTPPAAAGACAPGLEPATVNCPATGLVRVVADLGDGVDVFSDTTYLNDRVTLGDRSADSVFCGEGKDTVRAEVLDELDLTCEAVDYGPPGKVGKLRAVTGGGRFVPIPGQRGARIDRRILGNVLQLIRRYKVRIGDGYSLTRDHARKGEHPLGLAVDIYPGPGGTWDRVDKLARWAEPRRNRPRPPFRWVGYNGDYNHGRGNHLHLSWMHSKGRFGRPVRTVWVWKVLPK